MQKLIAGLLALPVVSGLVGTPLVRHASRRRIGAGAGVVAILLVALASTSFWPAATTGTPPTRITALDSSEFTSEIRTGESPTTPVVVTFPGPMNAASVQAMLRIVPTTAVTFQWDATMTVLTIQPVGSWAVATLHTVTVEAGALDAQGRPLAQRLRSTFLTRDALHGTISPTDGADDDVAIATAFRIGFTGPIDESTLDLLIDPPVEGILRPSPAATDAAPAFLFVPDDPLAPDTTYTVRLAPGTADLDGVAVAANTLTVHTAAAPAVVRFRPRNGWADVAPAQRLSVRFTEPMDHASTEAAWSAVEGTATLSGTFAWAENDTVLVFDPKANLGYSQKVTMTVAATARSRAGVPLAAPASATFTTVAKPTRPSGGSGGSGGGGGSVGAGTWAAVESYYLGLMNCTRTGGWVTSSGSCSSPGGRNVAALWQDAGISSKVSRPYAKKLAVNNMCTHFSGGNPGDRLRAAGYSSYVWAENLGCRSGDPFKAVLGSHLYFQSEKSYNGGHYVNLMNAKYDRVGIGVWVSSGRVRLVVDFYHPL